MKKFKVSLWTNETFEVIASDKYNAELIAMQDLSDEQRGTCEIEVEELCVEGDEE